MNHYLQCKNSACGFVMDVRINGTPSAYHSWKLEKCPECGSEWSSGSPLSGDELGVELLRKLPTCSCCTVHLQAHAH